MNKAFRNAAIRTKLGWAFGLLVAAATIMIAVVVNQLDAIRQAVELNGESAQVIRVSHVAEKGLIRVNSQMRGILLTGNFEYLDTYKEGQQQFSGGTAELAGMALDTHQRRLLAKARHDARQWLRAYGFPLIAMAATAAGRQNATRIVIAAGDKARVTKITKMISALRDIEEARIAVRENRQHHAIAFSFVVLAGGGMALIGIAVFMAWLIWRTVTRPLVALTDTVTKLAEDDYDALPQPENLERGDEIGRIARSVETFRTNGLRKAALEEETRTLRDNAAKDARTASELTAQQLVRDRITIDLIGQGLAAIASGDLTYRFPDGLPTNAAALKTDFDVAIGELEELLGQVRATTASVDRSAVAIARVSADLATRTTQQAASILVVQERLETAADIGRRNAVNTQRTADVTALARLKAEQSGRIVESAVTSMGRIEVQSEQVNASATVIEEIATRTRTLALNALIEAARAGDVGEGFAVVAKEVSALAKGLREAVDSIRASVVVARECVSDGVELVDKAGKAFGSIVSEINEIAVLSNGMAAAAHEQAHEFEQITGAVREFNGLTTHNAELAENTRTAGSDLLEEATLLDNAVSRFRIGKLQQR